MPGNTIRTLVVDDSVFMRSVLKNALAKADGIEVIGSAQNGREAIDKIRDLKPDVVSLDIEMPGIDGIAVLRQVMKDCPLPIVMVSTKTREGAQLTFDALELGAVDYVAKPVADKGPSLGRFQEKVIQAVRAAYACNRSRLGKQASTRILKPRKASIQTEGMVVAIGISTGGPATLHKLVPMLPEEFPPIVVTQHMPADFTGPFARRLDAATRITVKEAERCDTLRPGLMLLAPGNRHLRVVRRAEALCATLDDGPKVVGFRPSVDVLFESVADAAGKNAIGLVMTGMGCDGADGIRRLRAAGARTLAQDQESSIVYGMPKAAADTGCVDQVISLADIPDVLVQMLTHVPMKTA